MPVTRASRSLAAAVASALVLGGVPARADLTKAQCVDANVSAQNHRRAGKLALARDQLRLCSDPRCPRLVRDDCTQRLEEVDGAQPTIVFDVKDAAGGDIGDVEVSVDGKVVTQKLDGTAVAVDPGEHTFSFRIDDQDVKPQVLLVKEGERSRRLTVKLGPEYGAVPVNPQPKQDDEPRLPPPPPPPLPPPAQRSTAATAGSIALGGAGIVGLGVGALLGVLASSNWSSAKSACGTPTTCPGSGYSVATSDHDSAVTDGAVSTVAFVAGGALLAGGAALYFFSAPSAAGRPARSSPAAPAAVMHITPRFAPGSAGIEIGGAL